jgi:hypothetical protein
MATILTIALILCAILPWYYTSLAYEAGEKRRAMWLVTMKTSKTYFETTILTRFFLSAS